MNTYSAQVSINYYVNKENTLLSFVSDDEIEAKKISYSALVYKMAKKCMLGVTWRLLGLKLAQRKAIALMARRYVTSIYPFNTMRCSFQRVPA